MNDIASFPTQGHIFGRDVQPWHYRVEAENLRHEANFASRQRRFAEAALLRGQADRFDSIADKHNWHPSALRSMVMRSRLAAVDRSNQFRGDAVMAALSQHSPARGSLGPDGVSGMVILPSTQLAGNIPAPGKRKHCRASYSTIPLRPLAPLPLARRGCVAAGADDTRRRLLITHTGRGGGPSAVRICAEIEGELPLASSRRRGVSVSAVFPNDAHGKTHSRGVVGDAQQGVGEVRLV